MKKHLFGMALTMSVVLCAGLAMAQTIDEIQVYDRRGCSGESVRGPDA